MTPTRVVCQPTRVEHDKRAMQMTRGRAGWWHYDDPSGQASVFMRLTDGAVSELYLKADPAAEIDGAALRALPLARMRALVTDRPDLVAALDAALGDSQVPDLDKSLEATAFPAGWIKERKPRSRTDDSVRLSPTSSANGLTDAFLQEVADAYRAAVARGEPPNQSLAAQVGFPPKKRQATVERWVYLARKKGYLSPTRRGSIG